MMMQNSTMGAMLLNPRIMDLPQRSVSSGFNKGDDTFMDMLNERIQARQDSSLKSPPAEKPEFKVKTVQPEIDNKKAEIKDSGSRIVETKEPGTPKTAKADDSEEVLKKDEPKDNTKETIITLESMVSLLEDLLARLDMKTVTETTVESLKPEAATQLMPIASENISPMELLKALLEGNAEELKSLIGQTDESQLPAALKGFMEKIQELLGKMSSNLEVKAGDKDLIMEASGNEVSREELISQLKAQVRDVVEKLKERIFEHKTAQPQGIVTDEAQISVSNFSESTQTNSENGADASKHEAKSELKSEDKVSETNGKTTQTATSQETVQRNQSVENKTAGEFAIPSEQKSPETANVRIEKTTLPLSEKPLAQTVTNQVTMKVKLMAGENKQEMEMHLKPESLGKLSLKIIHERGEILARITAENEHVKGILESNMQLLKDALEKSGLTVQSLSVFVGNGQEKNQSRQDLNGNYRSNERGLSESFKSSSTVETLNERARVRDFYDQSSQINLTA